ncbi:hypothetical protein Goari_016946 [Gossypium aridum]|uniref:RNase H type-1 domain-containing protein n=1 Tax=Gossypium aridum TaxID=34290 RepID=A0A7J8WKK2_GOSAI|nr:hypothetical protein [Gossypium aridum]
MMIGGVVQDSVGSWLEGFRKYTRRGSALKSEICDILIGLQVARLRKYIKVIVESDRLYTIEMILEISVNIPWMTLIQRINEVRRKLQEVKFQFVPREGNMVADWFTKSGSINDAKINFF